MSTDNSAIRYNLQARASGINTAGVLNGSGVGGHGEPGAVSSAADDRPYIRRRARVTALWPDEPAETHTLMSSHEESSPDQDREYALAADTADYSTTESRGILEFTNLDRSLDATGGVTSDPVTTGVVTEVSNNVNVLSAEQNE
ncbi:hypothetical protein H0H92_015143 [Tricholoma furcatifolium]|nr:hypothetical protein H0H92_015143 [Tricholoma furcatifolium]